MIRKTSLFASLVLSLTPFLLGQEAEDPSGPRSPQDIVTSQQLIVWTGLQQPRPVPQPLPPPGDPQTPPVPPHAQQPAQTQTFAGKIVKDGDTYVLYAGGASYQLDDQNNAKQYENKNVKIVGTLDPGSNKIHIVKIELLS